MKKIYLYIVLIVSLYLFVFNTGCGLDSYAVVNAPSGHDYLPQYEQINDYYFQFRTNENQSSDFTFQGTAVYYKIYNDSSQLETEYQAITKLAEPSDEDELDVEKVKAKIDSYGYQSLTYENKSSSEILVPPDSSKISQTVMIQLADFSDKPANITVDGKTLNGEATCRPMRNGGKFSFEFGKDSSTNIIPGTSNSESQDYYISSTPTEEGKWYVCMFAVEVGQTTEFVTIYSNFMYLGDVTISEN